MTEKKITIDGIQSALCLESATWESLAEIALRERQPVNAIFSDISKYKVDSMSMESAIQVFVKTYFQMDHPDKTDARCTITKSPRGFFT
jgi:predicted DNA-binding ribbon-helix-helix protein